jgi:hypothetical protein
MKRQYRWRGLAVLATGVVLSSSPTAQTPPTQTPPTQSPATQAGAPTAGQERPHGTVTATGCLQRGGGASDSASTSTAPGETGSGARSGSAFVLKNARMTAGAESSASAPSTASTPSASTAAGQSQTSGRGRDIRLTAGSGVNLDEHVGHQVSVTGTTGGKTGASSANDASGANASQPSAPAGAQAAGDRHATMGGHTLMVSSITMVSATCPAGS